MFRARLVACLLSCVWLTGCISTRIEHFYEPSGDGTYRSPDYIWTDDTCSGAGPQYMTFDLGQGVKVTYRWIGGIEGTIYVPAGVRAEFPEGIATARSDSGAEVQGRLMGAERTVWYGNSKATRDVSIKKQTIAPTAPLVGWSEQDVLQSGVIPAGTFVDPKGASERQLSWNVFKFFVTFDKAPSDTFTVRPPAIEVNGQTIPAKEVHFRSVTKKSRILEPCV
jgi:hypothetical protein